METLLLSTSGRDPSIYKEILEEGEDFTVAKSFIRFEKPVPDEGCTFTQGIKRLSIRQGYLQRESLSFFEGARKVVLENLNSIWFGEESGTYKAY